MRVALIRGSLLRPWELPNYQFGPDAGTTFFASASVGSGLDATGADVRRLPSVADATRRLSPRVAGGLEWVGGSLEHLVGLERALAGFDVAHASELGNPFSLQAVRARDAGAVRRVVISVWDNILYNRWQNGLVERRVGAVARGIDHAVAMSELARAHLESAGVAPDRITVLPVGIDVEWFSPAPPREPEGPLRVVSVARLEPAKGVEDLVIAVGLARRAGTPLELTLVGEGPLRGRLEQLARRLGMAEALTIESTTWPAVAEVYRRHDVFVLASAPTRNWREQYGFAVVEAMASGLPVIAGDSGSLPEVVGRPESLVRPHDPLALRRHLERLAADPQRRAREGAANREWAVSRYGLDVLRPRLLDVYRSVLERPPVTAEPS